ncbi:MAG: hypothetical protein GXX99_02805 [Clostridiales bacterium]|nr:hypothetical protein [Clostridiales bacterium]
MTVLILSSSPYDILMWPGAGRAGFFASRSHRRRDGPDVPPHGYKPACRLQGKKSRCRRLHVRAAIWEIWRRNAAARLSNPLKKRRIYRQKPPGKTVYKPPRVDYDKKGKSRHASYPLLQQNKKIPKSEEAFENHANI